MTTNILKILSILSKKEGIMAPFRGLLHTTSFTGGADSILIPFSGKTIPITGHKKNSGGKVGGTPFSCFIPLWMVGMQQLKREY